MSITYLDPKESIAAWPDADENIESIGRCCLDVNGKPAYLVRGRGGGVWGMIFMMVLTPIGFTAIETLNYPRGKKELIASDLMSSALSVLSITAICYIFLWLTILYLVRIWRTHIPIRFNRKTRKVYLHHWGKTFITDWDNIRAYLRVQLSAVGSGATTRDPQVHIEFQRENGSTFEIMLRAKKKFGGSYDAAAFWEYIRIYMEDGPEKLPLTDVDERERDMREGLRDILQDYKPANMFESDTPYKKARGILLFVILLPLNILFIITDYFYFRLLKRIKVNPFPPELEEPCLCNETKARQEVRLAEIRSQLETNTRHIQSAEQKLRDIYDEWFVDLRFPGHEQQRIVDGVPEGWCRVNLTNLVFLNPANHLDAGQESWYMPSSALPESGIFIEQDKLERRSTPTSITFCNGDTIFPRSSRWFENGLAGYVEFMSSGEVACGSEELVVMRGKEVSPEFTSLLATNRHLREHVARYAETATGEFDLDALADFSLPMPPIALHDEFDHQFAKPLFRELKLLVEEKSRLRQNEEYIVSHWSDFSDGPEQIQRTNDNGLLYLQNLKDRLDKQNSGDDVPETRKKRKKRKR